MSLVKPGMDLFQWALYEDTRETAEKVLAFKYISPSKIYAL